MIKSKREKIRQYLVIAALTLALVGTAAFPISTEPVSASTAQPATQATPANPEIPIQSVSFPKNVTLKQGESKTLSITVSPSNTTYLTNIAWGYQTNSCFNVKVNGYGTYWKGHPSSETITATKAGTGYLTPSVDIYDSTGAFVKRVDLRSTVTVSGTASQPTTTTPTQPTTKTVALNSISLSKTSISMTPGQAAALSVYYNPSNTTANKTVTWTSSNSAVARVSGGTITAVKAGSATITASCSGKTATCRVTVNTSGTTTQPTTAKPTQPTTKTIALNSISLSKTSVALNPGQAAALSVYYNPSNTTVSKSVKWTSSNSAVARVSGGTITAVNAGSATITASCSGKTATCKVTVQLAEKYRNVSEAYTLLNKFRTTKSNQWYWKSDNKTKKKVTGLKKLKRDAQLEKVAKLRAKEQWIMYYERGKATHTRPNGKAWSTAFPSKITNKAENLAWGHETCKSVITGADGWAETYNKYKYQGHRRNMLSKKVTKVGIACYEKNGQTCWAMCLGK